MRISNNPELMRLVQQQLNRISRARTKPAAATQKTSQKASQHDLDRIKSLTEENGYTQEDMQRAVVQGMLTEEFGDRLMNEPQFQQVVDKVNRRISQDPEIKALVADAIKQLSD